MYDNKEEDAKYRIKKFLVSHSGAIYLSFSGGKDSTVLAHLIKTCQKEFGSNPIPFVFSNTGLELPETVEFVKHYDYGNKVTIYPNMKPKEVFDKYGKPAISKEWDDRISTYQNKLLQGYSTSEAIDPNVSKRASMLVGRHPKWKNKQLAKKNKWVLSTKIKISNKCCDVLKKKPFSVYVKENNMDAVILGVRTQESILRKTQYNSCYKKTKDITIVTPIYDWSNEDVEQYISKHNIDLSNAYTKLGYKRTGCYICPYNKNVLEDLEVLKKGHPNIYNYAYKLMGDIYNEKKLCNDSGQLAFHL